MQVSSMFACFSAPKKQEVAEAALWLVRADVI